MHSSFLRLARIALCAAMALPVLATIGSMPLAAQSSSAAGALTGTVLDPRGVPLPGAAVVLRNESTNAIQKMTTDAQGKYSFANVPSGKYTIEVDAPGFNTSKIVGQQVATGQPLDVPVTLEMGNASEQVTVEANAAGSIASALAPMDALLDARSARTEITQAFIQNFTSPLADYGEAVEMAPGTFTTNGNGVGLGQSKTIFRGFPDGDYDIDFDGIPFYDTNTPTHHSWAFFPSQWLGGIDFDRSPGTASTIGPTPFGGSIHLLSRDVSPVQNIRGGVSYGSWGTLLADVQYDSGYLGAAHKAAFELDVQHMDSKGYETNNFQNRNAGSIKVQYKFSPQTILTGFSGVVWVDANTPNFAATRCQMYGASSANSTTTCIASGTTLLPYTGAGIRFLNADNTDPLDYLDYKYNYYHVPTDFEYVGLHMERSHGIIIDFKPYTYNYDNSEKYTNAVPITEATTVNYNGLTNQTKWYGIAVNPCDVAISKTKAGITTTAEPCGVDKYNSYRKYGETLTISQVSHFGILRAGMWYEWADTNRHQFPSDPLNNWADQSLSNFNESFWTNSYQPYAEYDFHATHKLDITAGVKFAYYTVATKQYADDGKTIGGLGTNNPASFITNGGNYFATLPSIDANYRLKSNWSIYGQVATGSIVPPSSVFDFNQSTAGVAVQTLPKQQKSTTYQGGTVFKLKRVTFDADYYHVRFDNSYSDTLDSSGEPVFYLQPSSITQGVEGESNIYFGHGISAYLNATVGKANYIGILPASCVTGATGCTATTPVLAETASSNLWVQQTPSDTETEGLSYQNKAWDAGIFNKRVGTFYIDNGAYHNQATINPFSLTNAYINYTVRSGSHFDQTKIRLSVNNLFNEHSITGDSITGTAAAQTIAANGTTYTDLFNTAGQTPINGGDNISVLPGRSIILSVTFGLSPKR
jgi:iron complex outermembrane recepter protein